MSYDLYLLVDTGGTEKVGIFSINHTSNTSGIWYDAGVDLKTFDGKQASQIVDELTQVIDHIVAHKVALKKFEPSNGWGTVESTLEFLAEFRTACLNNPKTEVSVSY